MIFDNILNRVAQSLASLSGNALYLKIIYFVVIFALLYAVIQKSVSILNDRQALAVSLGLSLITIAAISPALIIALSNLLGFVFALLIPIAVAVGGGFVLFSVLPGKDQADAGVYFLKFMIAGFITLFLASIQSAFAGSSPISSSLFTEGYSFVVDIYAILTIVYLFLAIEHATRKTDAQHEHDKKQRALKNQREKEEKKEADKLKKEQEEERKKEKAQKDREDLADTIHHHIKNSQSHSQDLDNAHRSSGDVKPHHEDLVNEIENLRENLKILLSDTDQSHHKFIRRLITYTDNLDREARSIYNGTNVDTISLDKVRQELGYLDDVIYNFINESKDEVRNWESKTHDQQRSRQNQSIINKQRQKVMEDIFKLIRPTFEKANEIEKITKKSSFRKDEWYPSLYDELVNLNALVWAELLVRSNDSDIDRSIRNTCRIIYRYRDKYDPSMILDKSSGGVRKHPKKDKLKELITQYQRLIAVVELFEKNSNINIRWDRHGLTGKKI